MEGQPQRVSRNINPAGAAGGAGPAAAGAVEQLNSASLIQHDELVDILQVLDYETKFCDRELKPISRAFFAPASAKSLEAGSQFKYFSSLSSWLLKELGVEAG